MPGPEEMAQAVAFFGIRLKQTQRGQGDGFAMSF